MAEGQERIVTEEGLEELARAAELLLDTERRSLLAPQLDALVEAANRLNRAMAQRHEVAPVVQFMHSEVWREMT